MTIGNAWKVVAAVSALTALPVEYVDASIISFDIESRLIQAATPPGSFTADTGLAVGGPFTWTGKVTFDSDLVTTLSDGHYLFDGPGAGFTINLGSLTLFSNRFGIDLFDEGACDRMGTGFVAPASTSVSYAKIGFQSKYCGPTNTGLPDHSLQSLIDANFNFFTGTTFESAITYNNWQILGNVNGITRVPEPASLALIFIGLLGVGTVAVKRNSATRRGSVI